MHLTLEESWYTLRSWIPRSEWPFPSTVHSKTAHLWWALRDDGEPSSGPFRTFCAMVRELQDDEQIGNAIIPTAE